MRTDLCTTAAVAALALAPSAGFGQSGYANAPFRDAPVAVAHAAALERIAVYARALGLPGGSAEDEDDEAAAGAGPQGDEEEEARPLADLALVRGSLTVAAPDLAGKLAAAVGEMAEGGDGGAAGAAAVLPLVEEAKAKLLPADMAITPAFRAAVMASLLLDEGGVAEGYEEAVDGESQAYTVGYFALQRVEALWAELAAAAPERGGVDATLAILADLFPSGTPPATLSPDPEQAEAPAQQVVGLLEAVTDAELYPGRDLAGAAARVQDIAEQGCAALAAGDGGLGLETLAIAASYYDATVADTLLMLAPEAGDAVASNLEAVNAGEPAEAAGACPPLLDALAAGQGALTP